ncbi:MAG: hypothetical protein HZB67_01770 [Candidatus Aenigmarchaeota archaeon]|nr:hypothetical protein [Candidatus Aenigmarchaeota archaeon]
MVGLCGREIEFSSIPVSERLYFYNLFHKNKYKHLYYCRKCVLNFESMKPAAACSRCGGGEIVELHPKNFMKSDMQLLKEFFGKVRTRTKYKLPTMKARIKKPSLCIPNLNIRMPSSQKEELPTR